VTDLVQEVVGRALTQSRLAAWNLGMRRFGVMDDLPRARGLLVGEAPGSNTDVTIPLFPEPGNSADRLLRYSGVSHADWLGKLVKINLCEGSWSVRRAVVGRARALAYLLDRENYYGGQPLRVLLLGVRAARAWSCYGPFGYEEMVFDRGTTLRAAWIPHPSGRNRLYNERANQLRARRAVLWAIGERATP